MRKIGAYKAGKCDACGGTLTLIQHHSDREIIGHADNCKVKNNKDSYCPDLPSIGALAKEIKRTSD